MWSKKKELIQKKNVLQKRIETKKQQIIQNQERFLTNLSMIKKQLLYDFKNNSNHICGDSTKNTVLLIEPRYKEEIIYLLANTYKKLGNEWNYVFYCGKSYQTTWRNVLPNFIEIRPLEHDNFYNVIYYSDFCKKKELWESLYGEYVLTIQSDTWIMNYEPFTISYFIHLNKSYIGGNMDYTWHYFNKIGLHHTFTNFNGGLSLRKRMNMIQIIETYPPLKTKNKQIDFLSEHEDVYFIMGCIKLNLPVGDDENCSHFALHTIYHDKYFGIHKPDDSIKQHFYNNHPYLKYINSNLRL